MKLKTAHVIYYEWRSDGGEDWRGYDLNWDDRVEYFDDEAQFANRKYEILGDNRTRNVEIYHGTIMKSYNESEA